MPMHRIRFHVLPLLTLLLATPATLLAESTSPVEPDFWERTQQKSGELWEASKEGAEKGAEWTREKSGQAWEATKEGAEKGANWIRGKINPSNNNEAVESPTTSPL